MLDECEIRSAPAGRSEFEASDRRPWQSIDHTLPSVWEVVERRVQFYALDLGAAVGKGFRYSLQTLPVSGRHPVFRDSLDGGHVGQPSWRVAGESAVPPFRVPSLPPIEECARDVDRIDFKRPVEKSVRCRNLPQALEIAERRITRMRSGCRQPELGFEDLKKPSWTERYHSCRSPRGFWLQPIQMDSERNLHACTRCV